jgi:hypothetical protein
MLISLSVHYGPATISGFDTLEGCRAAEPIVVAFYKKTTTSVVKTECIELPGPPRNCPWTLLFIGESGAGVERVSAPMPELPGEARAAE